MYDAVVAGHLCLDIFPDLSGGGQDRLQAVFQPGQLVIIGPADYCTGGPVSNTGLALTRLGIDTRLMGKVGDDLFGCAIRDHISGYGTELADAIAVDPLAHSSYTIVLTPPGVDRTFLHYPGANDTFTSSDISYNLLRSARLFHFGYPPLMKRMYEDGGIELMRILRGAKDTGITTSLDMALPDPSSPAGRSDWSAILRNALPYVDIFVPSIEEILYMLKPATYQALHEAAGGFHILPFVRARLLSDLGQELIGLGAGVVGLKLGDRGLYLRTSSGQRLASLGRGQPSDPSTWADKELWSPCFRVKVVGTTGAGDATIAGLLSGLLRDQSLEQAITAAVAVGACSVESADALSGIRPWEETWQRVGKGWERHELEPAATGWVFDDQHQLWERPVGTSCATCSNASGV
jgi:sugar/nucleoside kinase (ribokinase family)